MTLSVQVSHAHPGFALDVAFTAPAGVTALFGPSGAGKTSVIHAVAGLTRPDRAMISFDGDILLDTDAGHFLPPSARRCGYVFQEGRLFPHLTVAQNLNFGAQFAPADAAGPSRGEVIDLLGIDALLPRKPGHLSGGEKQRVAIGRALLSRPRLLLMDEPLASLDAPRKHEILPYLERLRDGPFKLPMLYVSHEIDEVARLADTLVLMDSGRVAMSGPAMDVFADPAAVPLIAMQDAGALLVGEVIAHAEDGLTALQLSAGVLHLPGVRASVGSRIRLRVRAQDVILSRDRPEGLSALNVLETRVERIENTEGSGVIVALRAGNDAVLARITKRALQALGLRNGDACFAILKSTSIAPWRLGR